MTYAACISGGGARLQVYFTIFTMLPRVQDLHICSAPLLKDDAPTCVFPFAFNGTEHTTCVQTMLPEQMAPDLQTQCLAIKQDSGACNIDVGTLQAEVSWCATTSNSTLSFDGTDFQVEDIALCDCVTPTATAVWFASSIESQGIRIASMPVVGRLDRGRHRIRTRNAIPRFVSCDAFVVVLVCLTPPR